VNTTNQVKIQIQCELIDKYLLDELEAIHVDTLKRAGVPLRGFRLFDGSSCGELSWHDEGPVRNYTWINPPRLLTKVLTWKDWISSLFRSKHRIHLVKDLCGARYEVSEKRWYWPFWDKWATMGPGEVSRITTFASLYAARHAIRYRLTRADNLLDSVIEYL